MAAGAIVSQRSTSQKSSRLSDDPDLIELRCNPKLFLTRQLGHASIAITADVYGHLAPDATRQAAEAWDAIIAPTCSGRNPGATTAQDPT